MNSIEPPKRAVLLEVAAATAQRPPAQLLLVLPASQPLAAADALTELEQLQQAV